MLGLEDQIAMLQKRYEAAQAALDLAPETAIFRRLYLSDVLNQANLVRASALVVAPLGSPVAVSIVQQPPMGGAKIALMAYHVESRGAIAKRQLSRTQMLVEKMLASGDLERCTSRRIWKEFLGRPMTQAEETAYLDSMVNAFVASGWNLKSLIEWMVTSDLYRRID